MIILIAVMLAIGILASLALASACLIGQALVESHGYPAEFETEDSFALTGRTWQTAAVKVAH